MNSSFDQHAVQKELCRGKSHIRYHIPTTTLYAHQQIYRTQKTLLLQWQMQSVSRETSFLSPWVLLSQSLYIRMVVFSILVVSTRNITRHYITLSGIIGRISLNLPEPTTPINKWGFTTDCCWIWRYRISLR